MLVAFSDADAVRSNVWIRDAGDEAASCSTRARPFPSVCLFDWLDISRCCGRACRRSTRAGKTSSLKPTVASDRDPDVTSWPVAMPREPACLRSSICAASTFNRAESREDAVGLDSVHLPYEKRLKEPAHRTVSITGMLQRRSPGFGLAILTTQRQHPGGRWANDEHWLRNGGLRVGLFSITSSQRAKHWLITAGCVGTAPRIGRPRDLRAGLATGRHSDGRVICSALSIFSTIGLEATSIVPSTDR